MNLLTDPWFWLIVGIVCLGAGIVLGCGLLLAELIRKRRR